MFIDTIHLESSMIFVSSSFETALKALCDLYCTPCVITEIKTRNGSFS